MEISAERKKELIEFISKFGLNFEDFSLLNRAFVHTSYTNENSIDILESYERLEFLGDAVLKIAISDFLFKKFPDLREGDLTKHRSWVVSDKELSVFAGKIGLSKLILLGKNEECLGGREKPSILACAFEAFLGAIFFLFKELGLKAVYDFLIDNFENEILNSKLHNYKAILQEYTQGESHKLPVYKVLDEFGLSHDKTYIIGVYYNDILVSEGEGRSKKDAEQAAAKKALEFLKVEIV